MKTHFTKKEQIVIIILISIIVLVLGFKFFSNKLVTKDDKEGELIVNADGSEDENKIDDNKEGQEEIEEQAEYEGNIIIHISGQVKNPGIVELQFGGRLIDAVELLGGLTQDADGDRINLARKLQDEEKIYIPKIGEELEEDLLEDVQTSNNIDEGSRGNQDNTGKIDINTCTKEDLNSLPGIGDVLSERILDYRDENIFKAIEDIMNVSGIGAKKFEGLKDLIIVK